VLHSTRYIHSKPGALFMEGGFYQIVQ